jgi:hypothetical protein
MKLTLAVAALLLGSVVVSDLLAQGQVNWGNNLPAQGGNPAVRAPIYGVPPVGTTPQNEIRRGNTSTGLPQGTQTYAGALLNGTGFTMAIYLGRTSAECLAQNTPPTLGGTAPFRTGGAIGFVNQFTATADNIPGGTTGVNYQLRAWDNQNGQITSWSQVMASGGMVASGTSDVLVLGGALSSPPNTPPYADGLRSFQLTQVPEPSLIALGALGLGALLLRRRK